MLKKFEGMPILLSKVVFWVHPGNQGCPAGQWHCAEATMLTQCFISVLLSPTSTPEARIRTTEDSISTGTAISGLALGHYDCGE